MADSKLVFVGETHGLVAPRLEFASAVEKFHHFHPQRRVVIFMEPLYLKPLENESVFPYDYYRRGTEGVESPFDITNTKSPNFRLMDDNSNFREMLTRLLVCRGKRESFFGKVRKPRLMGET
ncbi:MAG: hypothetical protein MJ053_06070 [Elusimicrobiaceae bacterium]|nr:hypothetical protein [Elusimicrobiaceae bacterium]